MDKTTETNLTSPIDKSYLKDLKTWKVILVHQIKLAAIVCFPKVSSIINIFYKYFSRH